MTSDLGVGKLRLGRSSTNDRPNVSLIPCSISHHFALRLHAMIRTSRRIVAERRVLFARNASTEAAAQQSAPPPPAIPAGPAQPLQPSVRTLTAEQKQYIEMAETNKKLRTPPKAGDRGLYLTALALLLFTPPVCYFWWQHRAEHMGQKKQEMIKELQERRKAFREAHKS